MILNTKIFFFACSFLYIFAFPIELGALSLTGKTIHGFDLGGFGGHWRVFYAGVQAVVGFWVASAILSPESWHGRKYNQVPVEIYRLGGVVGYSSVIMLLLSFIFFGDEWVSSVGSYESAYSIRYSNPVFSLSKSAITVLFAISLAINISLGRAVRAILAGSVLVSFWLLLSDKDPLLLAVLAMLAGLKLFERRQNILRLFCAFVSAVALLCLSKGFSYFRAGKSFYDSMIFAYADFRLSNLDAVGPYTSIVYFFSKNPDYRLGSTYLVDVQNIMPKGLYGDRALTLAERFARDIIPNWSEGQGLGFSPLAEAYINFGLNGVFIHFLVFGLVWGLFWRLAEFFMQDIFKLTSADYKIVYFVFGYYLMFLSFRNTSFAFTKPMLHFFSIFMFFLLVRWVCYLAALKIENKLE